MLGFLLHFISGISVSSAVAYDRSRSTQNAFVATKARIALEKSRIASFLLTNTPKSQRTMSALLQLKSYGTLCPFLHRTPSAALRSLSVSTIAGRNSLTARAEACPLMGLALAAKGLHTSAVLEAGEKSGQQTHTRHYASIAPQETTLLQQASIVQGSGSNPAVSNEVAAKDGTIVGHRPTNALGFAERIAERGGGFQFEQFYQGEIDKKLKDKSTFSLIVYCGE